jgi:type I restriction enzyme S subunit
MLEADRVAMPKINRETLNELRVPMPPSHEQKAVAEFLDRETAKIDQMLAKIEAVIDRLQEYRSALITVAVTGKIDVRTLCDGSHNGNNTA